MSTHRLTALALLLASAGLAAPALAQNALGDGRGQENKAVRKYPQNDQPKGGRDFAAEVQFRNAIVTGNAPGGLSFRGNAGYTAPNSFRSVTGADDLYSFRRDSYYSGLSGQGIRGTEALQYQFAMTTGSSVPRGIVGSLGVARPGDKTTTIARDTTQRDESSGTDWLRSPSSYASSRALKPTSLGERPKDDSSYYRLMSSSLLGLKVQKVDIPRRPSLAPTPEVKPAPETPAKPGDAANPSGVPKPAGTDAKKPEEYRTSYDQIVERLSAWRRPGAPAAEKPAGEKPGAEKPGDSGAKEDRTPLAWERRVDALRRHLLGLPVREVDDRDKAPLSRDDEVSQLNADTLRMLRESGGEIRTFAEVPDKRAALPLYARAMALGQEQLAAQHYFDAEDKFSRALAVRPRDPAAQAGRIHAQLGAGMYLSAAVNLREMVVASPETAGAKYGPSLLPDPARLQEILAVLRSRLADRENADPLARSLGERQIGFMLAYLGFQMGDDQAIKDGLAAVARNAGDSDEDKMTGRIERYLRGVWLGELPPELPEDYIPKPAEPEKAPEPEKKPAALPTPVLPPAPAHVPPTPLPQGDKKPAEPPVK